MSTARELTPGVDSARRVLKALLMFDEDRPLLGVDAIAEEVGISRPSAYRFLSLLREMELVEERGGGLYALTPRVFTLGSSAERAFEVGPQLRSMLNDVAEATGEAAFIMRRVGDHVICAAVAQTEQTIRLSFVPGQSMPLHRGAGPKMLLAEAGISWAERYLDRVGDEVADHEGLLEELRLISHRRWSTSSAEVDEGIWASAAPIVTGGRTLAVLSVAGPMFRIEKARQRQILDEVVTRARRMSGQLNGTDNSEPALVGSQKEKANE